MTSDRASAYGIAIKTLRDLQPAKFTAAQMSLFVECADALLWSDDPASVASANDLLVQASAELDTFATNHRLTSELVERIKAELRAIKAQTLVAG
jgi:hypothetical protein